MPIDRQQLAARLRALTSEPYSVCPFMEDSACEMERGVLITEAERDALLAALGAEAEPRGWQPIETHDKSRGSILVALIRDGRIWRVSDAWFNGLGYYDISGAACHWRTHWMPLPVPPSSGREEQA